MSHTIDAFVARPLLAATLVIGLARAATASAQVEAPVVTPRAAIQISAELRRSVGAMLQASPTFRQQFARILGVPRLVVHARVSGALLGQSVRARSVIRRYDTGLLVVLMEIGPGPGEREWIAHEFEHVIEQIDRMPPQALGEHPGRVSWDGGDGMIETSRAVRAGQAVMRELRDQTRRGDKYVE